MMLLTYMYMYHTHVHVHNVESQDIHVCMYIHEALLSAVLVRGSYFATLFKLKKHSTVLLLVEVNMLAAYIFICTEDIILQ